MKEDDCDIIVQFLHRAIQIALKIKKETPNGKFVDFNNYIEKNQFNPFELQKLKNEVIQFSRKFETIGYEKEGMLYK
jgi:hypothetical protein